MKLDLSVSPIQYEMEIFQHQARTSFELTANSPSKLESKVNGYIFKMLLNYDNLQLLELIPKLSISRTQNCWGKMF